MSLTIVTVCSFENNKKQKQKNLVCICRPQLIKCNIKLQVSSPLKTPTIHSTSQYACTHAQTKNNIKCIAHEQIWAHGILYEKPFIIICNIWFVDGASIYTVGAKVTW